MPPGTQVRRRCKEPREVAASDSCYFYEISILNIEAFVGLLFLLLVMAALLFIPAWTLDYWQAWTFLAVYSTRESVGPPSSRQNCAAPPGSPAAGAYAALKRGKHPP